VSSTAQAREEKERKWRKKMRGGSVPPLVSRPKTKREKREKGKRGRAKREGHAKCMCQFLAKVHVHMCWKRIKRKCGGGVKGATLGDDVSPRKIREGSVPSYLEVARS
jgi:hypothetical protein